MLCNFAFAQVDNLPSSAGWGVVGVLVSAIGTGVGWFFLRYLPQKEKTDDARRKATELLVRDLIATKDQQHNDQMKEQRDWINKLIEGQSAERERESKARHDMRNDFHQIITQVELDRRNDLAAILKENRDELEKSRTANENRNTSLIDAILKQTAELRMAIAAAACKFRPGDAACPIVKNEKHPT